MSHRTLHIAAAVALAAAAALATAEPIPVVPGEPAWAGKHLQSARLRLGDKAATQAPRVRLAPLSDADVERVRAQNERTRVGFGAVSQLKRLAIGLARGDELDAAEAQRPFEWVAVADGLAARKSVTSPEAQAVRVALDLRNAAPELEMSFFGSREPDRVFGPYRLADIADRSEPWWSPLTQGETITVEFFVPSADVPGADPRIANVGHLLVDPSDRLARDKRVEDIGDSGACNVDVPCSSLNASTAFRNLAASVAQMVFNDGGFTYLCTGTLLNDMDTSTQRPWFYSANHCFDKESPPYRTPAQMQSIANSLTTLWFFEAAACGSSAPNPNWQQVAGGATYVYNSRASDALFIRLNNAPPAGAFYSGWDASALGNGSAVVDVHHPEGDLKKVSQGQFLGFSRWDSATPAASHIEIRWSSGTTEGGSSGSGIFTLGGGQYVLRGGLHGGDALCSNPSGTDLFSRFDQVYPNLSQYLAAGTAAPDINQAGLDGMWFNPASSGQGFALQVVPNVASGRGYLQGGWFTFDVAPAGGTDRQRWYSLGGEVFAGRSSADLTIYQNVGGNFNKSPATSAIAVGNATLAFSSCTAGQLQYAFADGRSGSMPLQRLMPNITCSTSVSRPTNPDFALSGNWFDPATSGQGLIVEMNPSSPQVFVTWYTYAPDSQGLGVAGQRWYSAQNAYSPGSRSVALTLYETRGGVFDTGTPASQSTTAVGSATLTFTSCTTATLSFNFAGGANAGQAGSIALQRIGGAEQGCTL
jgi:hypothetical protein